ncbi:adenosylcobinamide-phosphate synthase CbiB [Desulforhopalus sp. 52FAK]
MDYSFLLIFSLVLDSIFGDPRWYPHPVCGIGWFISKCEVFFRRRISNLRLAGKLIVISVIGATIAIVFSLIYVAQLYSVHLETILAVVLIYMAFSTKDLLVHSTAVYSALLSDNPLENGRKEVGKIVGRDTSELNQEAITRACVETVAENMVDGATAPVFFAILSSFLAPVLPLSPIGCSALGIFAYKAINTMDSMIGYKNDQYIDLGRAAARLDDLVNFIPARISGVILIISAFVLRFNYRNSAVIYFRDRANHSSPNAAHPEAAVAGALGVRLGGPSIYFGTLVEKPYIGDNLTPINPEHIGQVNRLVVVAIFLFVCLALITRHLFSLVIT